MSENTYTKVWAGYYENPVLGVEVYIGPAGWYVFNRHTAQTSGPYRTMHQAQASHDAP